MSSISSSKPRIFDRNNAQDNGEYEDLLSSGRIQHVVDMYESQLEELYAVENPSKVFTTQFEAEKRSYIQLLGELDRQGKWVYFPWMATAVHLLDDEPFQKLRTARNRHLISDEEQKNFYNATIGIAGLSVGNSVALAIILTGGARKIKLADHDTLDLSNLNRIRAGVDALGLSKVEMTARQIYLLNPYVEIEIFREGLADSSLDSFFDDLDIVIDEIDNLAIKYRIREESKKRKVPVLMAADNDKMGVIDVERYDLESELEYFNGKLQGVTYESLEGLDKFGVGKTIATLVGLENHTPRMLTSLTEMGKSVVSWPQLGITALMNGSLLAYAAFKIANKQPLVSGRVVIGMDSLLDADFKEESKVQEREDAIEAFKHLFKS